MINSFKSRSAVSIFVVVAGGALAMQALAQAPTSAQRNAIKSSCRSDYMAHCASITPGGAASLQCLQKNIASLSSSCQIAVKAVSPAAEAKPAAEPAATRPAVTGGNAAPLATEATGSTTPAAAAGATAVTPAAAPAAPALVLRRLRPLEELRIVNAACGADARALCSAVEPGGGRIARCLAANAASLTPACKSMLAQFAAR
jgi:hypothetical protein